MSNEAMPTARWLSIRIVVDDGSQCAAPHGAAARPRHRARRGPLGPVLGVPGGVRADVDKTGVRP